MRDDVTVLNFDVKEFNFDIHNFVRLCTSVSASCSQAFHCDDVTLCVTLRTQFSTVFNMIIYFRPKTIILI